MKHPLAENRIIYKLPNPKFIEASYSVKFSAWGGAGLKVYRELRQQDELSVREPTEDKLPTTFSGQKEAIRSLPPSWDCTRKKTGSFKPSLELVSWKN